MKNMMGPDIPEPAETAIDAPPLVVARPMYVPREWPMPPAVKAEPPIEPAGWSPFQVAALRAGLTALLVGAVTFFSVWSHTNDAKEIALAVGPAMLGVIAARFGLEGNLDSARWERAAAKRTRR